MALFEVMTELVAGRCGLDDAAGGLEVELEKRLLEVDIMDSNGRKESKLRG